MDNKLRFPLILDGFWLKILALLTMTIDHIGYLLPPSMVSVVFRYIGRLALPLFCLMIAEGAVHTKSMGKYLFRLGLMASFISIVIICSEYIPFFKNQGFSMRDEGIIFLDLLLGALAIYLLRQKNWYIKLLATLPILYGIASFTADCLESCGCYGKILWLPFFMRTQYGFFAILLSVGFYLARVLTDFFIRYQSNLSGIDLSLYDNSYFKRNVLNAFSLMILFMVSTILYFVGYLLPDEFVSWDLSMQFCAVFSGAFILLYNGRRGYNKAWFQYGSYLYYPLHLAILYIIFSIIGG
ncbi:MAG TPA: hypothetical protein GX010_03360 [Erysipelotrichaceae bacterium]|nr:hypothetical protein [Erysipelotrichaceae bacterium]